MLIPRKPTAGELSRSAVRAGIKSRMTVSGAESCTGGLISKYLTDIPGSSAVLCGACVTYTNEAKMNLLGVTPALIEEHTEVSYACAEAMAEGARRTFGSDVAYSTTGYAGPTGGTERDPVGTVYVGISTADKTVSYRLPLPYTTRREVRESVARFVLTHLVELLTPTP